MKNEDSIKKRFGAKLTVGLLSSVLNFIIMLFFPRILGPENFGQYEYAINSFLLLIGALSLSIPDAFFSFISENRSNTERVKALQITLIFFVVIFALVSIFMLLLLLFGYFNLVWPGLNPSLGFISLAIAISTQFFNLLSLFADSIKLTSQFEAFRLIQNLFKFFFIALFCFLQIISLQNAMLIYLLGIIFSLVLAIVWFFREKTVSTSFNLLTINDLPFLRFFFNIASKYIKPLILYAVISFAFSFFDIWLLQFINGPIQQGYLSLSLKVAGLIALINTAIHPLLFREVALAADLQNQGRIASIIKKINIFFMVALFFGFVVYFDAEIIIRIIGGDSYKQSINVFKILAFYPAIQTLGKLQGAIFFSTKRTKIYSQIGIFIMPLGMFISFIFLGPLSLGAIGVSLKMILIDCISVFALMYFNSKFVLGSLKRDIKDLGHIFLFLFSIFYISNKIFLLFIQPSILSFFLKNIITTIFSLIIVSKRPNLLGMTKQEVLSHIHPLLLFGKKFNFLNSLKNLNK
jgi:O-antigen/teichoic acid export membrane protein